MPSPAGTPTPRSSRPAALAVGLGVTAVLVLAFLYVPHWLLVKLRTPEREWRAIGAALWIALALALSGRWAWAWSAPRTTVRGDAAPTAPGAPR